MQPLLSDMSFVTVTDLLPKKAIEKRRTQARRTPLGASFDLKH